ncbi:MAG: hypothetical protein ACD_22C00205G0006 [uncultured bacterium]|nr:MAG: hypothetical protein ACD_22C00205G0006 [uncultured bacterium]
MLNMKDLETWLWDAACSIRGATEAAKYKDYILPLIFIKRLSDVFDDEIEKLSKKFGSKENAYKVVEQAKNSPDTRLVRFFIPKEASWQIIRTLSTDIGEKLDDTTRLISKHNPKLQGVIDVISFNASVSGQRIIADSKLSKLIEIISRHKIGLEDAEPDVLGRAYEYLIGKFAEGSGKSAGEFYTPKEVAWLMAYILDPKPGEEVYDPTCGSGGLLIKTQLALNENHKNADKPLKLYGQEQDSFTYAIAKMNMTIHDMEGEIAIGDTLTSPKFRDGNSLKKFDIVSANPMWNQDGYDSNFYEQDKFGRFPYGFLSAQSADWGWVQHMHASLKESGRMAIVLDTGAVSRGSGGANTNKEREVRKAFVDNDFVEGVLLLPDNLFYNTSAPGIILFINKHKPVNRKGKTILINASKEFEKGKESSKNYITQEGIKKIVKAFQNFEEIEKFSRVIPNEEIIKNDYNLSPSRYVQNGVDIELQDIPTLLSEIKVLEQEEKDIDKKLEEIFKKLKL